jgi:kynureninase
MINEYPIDALTCNHFSGVFTHFHGTLPAATCDQPGKAFTAELVGAASEDEVVIMNGLSVNLVNSSSRPETNAMIFIYVNFHNTRNKISILCTYIHAMFPS